MTGLHHVNLPTLDARALGQFYVDLLGLEPIARDFMLEESRRGSVVLRVGDQELHLSQPRPELTARLNGINPVAHGHVAFRVADLDAIAARARGLGVRFAYPGVWSVPGWSQLYLEDPAGNVVECQAEVSP